MDKYQKRILGSWLIAALGVLAILVSAAAFGIGSDDARNAKDIGDALIRVSASDVTASINYQGKLTDNASEPLSGTYTMIFRLYDVVAVGTALDTDTHTVEVTDGLFNTHIDFNQSYFDGRELWLGITVGSDSEMMPRYELSAVPYALSLKPGAVINGSVHGSILDVRNTYGEFCTGISASTSGNISTGVFTTNSGEDSMGVFASTSGNYSFAIFASTHGDDSGGVTALTSGNYSDGVYAITSGYHSDGVHASTSGDSSDGISASTSGDYSEGVQAYTTGNYSDGVYVSTSGYGSDGISASTSGDYSDGVQAYTTGNYSEGVYISTSGYGSWGVYVNTTGNDNVGVGTSTWGNDSEGFSALTYGNYSEGVTAWTYGDNSWGVFAETLGDNSRGVSAATYGNDSMGFFAYTSGNNSEGVSAYTYGNDSEGVRAFTYGNYSVGVSAGTGGIDSAGIVAFTSGDDSAGVHTFTYGENSRGVSASSAKSDGIYAETDRSDHRYGVCTDDYMYALRYEGGGGDVAEYFTVDEDVEPGTVMVIGEDSKLQSSITAYDTTVAGIVSTAPGVSLGTNETGNVGEKLIAVAGRVPCKVDASYASVKPGDLLTTSDTRGHAMKATNPQIGTILGKALEPLDSGTGVIEVLVTLQ